MKILELLDHIQQQLYLIFLQIIFEFDHLFESKPHDFCSTWDKFKSNIDRVLTLHQGDDDICVGFDDEVANFVKLLKLLPSKPKGRGTKRNRLNFENTVDKIFVFAKVSAQISHI